MNYETRPVEIHRIDPNRSEFRITTRRNVDDLLPSIASLGVIQPPICVPIESRWQLVTGFRRLEACRRLGLRRVDVRVPSDRHTADALARLAVADNALERELNLIETSRALRLLRNHLPDPRQIAEAAAAVGLPAGEKFIARVAPLCELPDPVQEGIITGAIALPTADTR